MAAGIDNLIKCDDFAKEQVQETIKSGGGGVDSSDIKWRVGELEFEAWMRLLDSMVRQRESKTQFRNKTFYELNLDWLNWFRRQS